MATPPRPPHTFLSPDFGDTGGPPPPPPPDDAPIPLAGDSTQPEHTPTTPRPATIQAFDQNLSGTRHEDKWHRSPNVTGTGAIHVRSFHCKLNRGSLEMLDQQINEWLDEYPQYEVKFVTTAVGEWTGKAREPNLVVQVWV